ncbi:MAG: hypothetical protein CMD65_02080 [Gammaproteobacteria bacterium]|nr:hypothetical protein [Gammaproteobacteria bacterium]|tara:strand:- start:455 stop:718 length:264 start_codon:yes stop_codon:yes gene_type:complete
MYKLLSYLFFIIAIFAGYLASYELLLQVFPEFNIIVLAGWFLVTAMFFPLAPFYPGITTGNWMFAIVCYIAILIGVILGNLARKLKT